MERLNESRIGALITDAYAVRASTGVASTLHAQHGAAILIGLDAHVTVMEPGRGTVSGRVVVVPPHVRHATSSPGPTLALLYDPQAAPHIADYSRLRGGAFALESYLARRLEDVSASHGAWLTRAEVLDGLARESATWLAREMPRRRPDTRVALVLEALKDPSADPRLVLARTGLSRAHLRALFVREVGMPMRTYQLWRRLLVALGAFARLDATSAAHFAGFADLAHFSRTCRRMLGYSPTTLRGQLLREEGARLNSRGAPRPGGARPAR
ncbi:Transcriptional regulator, AraC family [Cystobacter fuscus DSM 2262]|uniref:Transcriptional regulator, AraC family n=1 Tax=Cystobacter fuscus (strain ATCC 25194 / DSM 2262 / NBRC 100088 / M29) TaxID=1242864 RepID=S9PNY6_CYSF2|nr:Transcriptional regulator, AraC family [Cystobacter fuscus DSM 2262]